MSKSDKNNTSYWIIIDDCEYFIAKCSNCGNIEDSRLLPSKCPKCSATMKTSEGINSLKPCPFCGGEADVVEDEVNDLVWCVCSTCGATGGVEGNNQDAIEVWNRRVNGE